MSDQIICRIRLKELKAEHLIKLNKLIQPHTGEISEYNFNGNINFSNNILYNDKNSLFLADIEGNSQTISESANSFVEILKMLRINELININRDNFYYICHDLHLGYDGSGVVNEMQKDYQTFKEIIREKLGKINLEALIFFQHRYDIDLVWTKLLKILPTFDYDNFLKFIIHFCKERDSQEQKRIINDIFLPLAIDIKSSEIKSLDTSKYYLHIKEQIDKYQNSVKRWKDIKDIKENFDNSEVPEKILSRITRSNSSDELLEIIKKYNKDVFSDWLKKTINNT